MMSAAFRGRAFEWFDSVTNAPGDSAAEIADRVHLSVHLINDFTAISYAVVLLDSSDEKQIARIPHTNTLKPIASKGMALVVGAGTGLGVGFIDKKLDGSYLAYPSEGGHSTMPCWDSLSLSFFMWLESKIGVEPGIELAVSGQGIGNIFSYLCSDAFDPAAASSYDMACGPIEPSRVIGGKYPEQARIRRPALIASNRMKTRALPRHGAFRGILRSKSIKLGIHFPPRGGIYLAAAFHRKMRPSFWKANDSCAFSSGIMPSHQDFLASVPVMIVRNYSISLIGAANAAIQLGRKMRCWQFLRH